MKSTLIILALTIAGCSAPSGVPPTHGPVVLRSTLESDLVALADATVGDPLRAGRALKELPEDVECGFVLLENSTGNVLAVIPNLGGRADDFATGLTNRDVGSVGKLVPYLGALRSGAISPTDRLLDARIDGPGWAPRNFGGRYSGLTMTLPEAIGFSSNVIAERVARRAGTTALLTTFDDLNLLRPTDPVQVSVGRWTASPLEVAAAYATIANNGDVIRPRFFTSARTPEGVEVDVVPIERRVGVFPAQSVEVFADGMHLCVTTGTGRTAGDLENSVRGKTGTGSLDAWAVLQSRRVTAVLWIGRRGAVDLNRTGGSIAMPALAAFFRALRAHRPELVPIWGGEK